MEILKSWVLNIATMVVFISAIEMILPDNSIKKYARFILGLILVSVILTPILQIFNGSTEKLENQINEYQQTFNESQNKDGILNDDLKEKKFKENLETNIKKLLKDKYENIECDVDIDLDADFKNMKFNIKKIVIYINNIGVKKVERIDISKSEIDTERKRSSKENDIRNFLNKELEVPKESIEVYE